MFSASKPGHPDHLMINFLQYEIQYVYSECCRFCCLMLVVCTSVQNCYMSHVSTEFNNY